MYDSPCCCGHVPRLTPAVAVLFLHLDHIGRVFWRVRERDQLDEHWLSLCLLRRQPVSATNVDGTRWFAPTDSSFSVVIFTLNKGGPKPAIIATSSLLLVGNWIRYAGAKAQGGIYGVVMFGQILIGFSQPFCLSAPTRYSDLWFSDRGRISATAVATLANPLGAAIGQLVSGVWATKPSDVPNMVLYVSIIVSQSACVFSSSPNKPRQPWHRSPHFSYQRNPQHRPAPPPQQSPRRRPLSSAPWRSS